MLSNCQIVRSSDCQINLGFSQPGDDRPAVLLHPEVNIEQKYRMHNNVNIVQKYCAEILDAQYCAEISNFGEIFLHHQHRAQLQVRAGAQAHQGLPG